MAETIGVAIVTNVAPPCIGGISSYVRDLDKGLRDRGIQSEIIAMPEAFNKLDEEARGHELWRRTMHMIFVGVFAVVALLRIASLRRRTGRLIVHSHSASYCLVVGVVARILGAVALHTFHSPIDIDSPVLRGLGRKADGLVFVSNALRNTYETRGVQHARTWVVSGGVDTSRFRPPSPEERLKARQFLRKYLNSADDTGRAVILFVGRIVPEKGVHVLVSACQNLAMKGLKFSGLIVGPPDASQEGRLYLHRCRDMIMTSQLSDRVVLTAAVARDELLSFYWAADVLVCPSTWPEPAAIVIPEAMASGVLVVASKVGGLAERIDDGTTGLLVNPGDSDGLANALTHALEDRTFRARTSENALKRATSGFDIDEMVNRYISIYDGLARRTKERRPRMTLLARGG